MYITIIDNDIYVYMVNVKVYNHLKYDCTHVMKHM